MELLSQLRNKYIKIIIGLAFIHPLCSNAKDEPIEEVIETKPVKILTKKSYLIDTATERTPRIPSSYEIMFVEEVQKNGFENNPKIVEIIEEATKNNDPRLTTIKAGMIATGTKYNYDFEQAAIHYKKGIELGDIDAQLGYGTFLLKNKGDIEEVRKNFNEFYSNHKEKRVEYIIGKIYFENNEEEEALPWLKRSADSGSDRAQFMLYEIYNRKNSEDDKIIADKWLIKSANNGNIKALSALRKGIISNQIIPRNKNLSVSILNYLIDDDNVEDKYKRTLNNIEDNNITIGDLLRLK